MTDEQMLAQHVSRICTQCGQEFFFPADTTPLWGMCATCHMEPRTLHVNVGPQPHLMSKGEIDMHMRNKHDIEKRVRAGEPIEFKEKGPLEFRPKP